jgi:hypothetical protein
MPPPLPVIIATLSLISAIESNLLLTTFVKFLTGWP